MSINRYAHGPCNHEHENPNTAANHDAATALVEELTVLYKVAAARISCQDHAQALGLLDRLDNTHTQWEDAVLRGMWYLLAHSILHTPGSESEHGRRLAEIEDITPRWLRMLDLDPVVEDNLAPDDPIANGFRTLIAELRARAAHRTTVAILRHTDEQTLLDWQFSKQLLGLGPDEAAPKDAGSQ